MGTILTHQLLRKRLSELRVRVEACEAASPEGARNSAGLFELEVLLEELLLQFEALYDAQGMLEESSAKVTEFFDLAPIPYFVLDQYGVILRANVAAARLLGRAARFGAASVRVVRSPRKFILVLATSRSVLAKRRYRQVGLSIHRGTG